MPAYAFEFSSFQFELAWAIVKAASTVMTLAFLRMIFAGGVIGVAGTAAGLRLCRNY